MKDLNSSLKIYAVTDRYWLNGRKLKDDVKRAILGGATMIQLREKDLSYDEFVKEAFEIKDVCKEYDVPFIINDSLDVFLAVDADGIHVGQNDMRADLVREKIGPNKILGVSAETLDEAILAQKMGADYLGVGTIFNTTTKLDAITVPIKVLADIATTVNIPVVAIGGITKNNICKLKNTNIAGISVVSQIFGAKDITSSTKELEIEFDKILLNFKNYDNFVVDYDGTLLDSLDMWDDIASKYVKYKGLIPEEDLDKKIKSLTVDDFALFMNKNYLKDKDFKYVMNDVNSFIAKEYINIKLNKKAKLLLDELKGKGKLILFTATSYELIEKSLKANNIFDYFDLILTSTNYNHTKVDGIGFEKIINDYNLDKFKTLIVEDSIHAIKGAKLKDLNVLTIKTKINFKEYEIIRKYSDYFIGVE